MSAYLEAFRAALTSLAGHRMRSFLTTLGILIGTASVIAVVSLVQGFSDSIKNQFSDLGGNALTLRAVVNGELRQQGSCSDMIFSPAALISFISRVMTLLPGDVVLTGTPAGVGPLVAGDEVSIEIDGVGLLLNPVIDEERDEPVSLQ